MVYVHEGCTVVVREMKRERYEWSVRDLGKLVAWGYARTQEEAMREAEEATGSYMEQKWSATS